ncbi:MAG: shikimate dehydrogenase [Gammaproteobacteria bacterium 28-57-27]|nr:MAG: shikimate dehydrogenase [Gammaproteobacteria bacterium 28-57-27]
MSIDHYAVIGNPISHSKSPRIHTQFAAQTGQNMRYDALLAPLDDFYQSVKDFQNAGGRGMNVTVPFKLEAYALADRLSPRAERAGAVNTLVFQADGSIEGDNTDGVGLVRDLQYHDVTLKDANILILGAGGAVRGVLAPLLATHPASLVIANRTAERAQQLAHDFADLGTQVSSQAISQASQIHGCGYDELNGKIFDVIINGTSASLGGELPPLPEKLLQPGGVAYDMAYGNEPTAFQRWAQARGASLALDGLGMLLEQAAESFYLWRGVRPDTQALRISMR